ncbi:SDR family oxidoreductase [Sediminitomix flava]|uniref:NAD(P)-dependent dehydrogenase (Short-subunit alcohol dehydrogenase family) n=1 Tax=Sediminitomix flava TaxID=379075 RepID=A0A315ZDS8_SEDFL|nr:SDR family oxidoreductase [Sediminitomix flava]PWJ43725.1 NAD(P)-dependent dehydrogenase (short-subunit alcohol dehydrogenase family) [Sediminitomix flava]
MNMNNTFGKKGWTLERIESLEGKTYLITGANTGAGFEAARILLTKGAEVVMLNRNAEKSNAAIAELKEEFGNEAKVSFIKMDLASLDSVRSAAKEVNDTIPQIDALICNAAIAQVPKQKFTVDGFESQLGVNHYGHFLLINLLFSKIDQTKGRIVVVGSEGYKMGLKTIQFDDMNWDKNYHPNHTYCHSKLAQIMFAYELQDRITAAQKNVKVYVCHPGASATSLIENSGGLRDRIIFGLMSLTPLVQSAEKGAYPEIMCATENEVNMNQKAYYGPTGRMQWTGPVGECKLESFAQDKTIATKLWSVSEQATGQTFQL